MVKGGDAVPASRRARRSVTISDVAHRAGVSTATVSRTLAMPDRVASNTREAVFSAIRETGYIPNATARSLRARSTKMVLALLNGIGDSFFTAILNSVEEALFEAGYGMVMGDTRGDVARESHYDRLVRSGQVDGVLLFSGRLPAARFGELDAVVPLTLVCNDIPQLSVPFVESANRDAARTLTEYLIGAGHRRIGHIAGPKRGAESDDRIAGYRDALAAAGIAFDPALVWQGDYEAVSGAGAARRDFLPMVDRPTAIFAANDETAIGFIKAVRDAGLSVPEDVSVAGFDDIGYAALFDPGLTTMHQPRAELGRVAAEILVGRMTGTGAPPPRITRLPCSLVVRESVAPPRASADSRRQPAAKAVHSDRR
jgi:LacI family transcriptional regulator, repressor for deo operon, udp, cdd, tsx, nupC, and nupG